MAEDSFTRPEIIAHRGLATHHRENTLGAFSAALEAGADGIELDVHKTRDGAVVVQHDPTLRIDTEGAAARPIAELTFEEIRGSDRTGSGIPLLEEVLTLIDGRCKVYVEVKAPHLEAEVARLLAPRVSWCAVHSFDHRCIARLRALVPDVSRGVLMSSYLIDPALPVADHAATDLWQQWELIDEDLIVAAHAHGARVVAWTVNDPRVARRLVAWGVDALCTDRADVFVHLASEMQT